MRWSYWRFGARQERLFRLDGWLFAALMVAVQMLAGPVSTATAANFDFRKQRGPYYVGEPTVVQVLVEGITSNKEPTCKWVGKPTAGITIKGPQVSRSSSQIVQMFNNRVSSKRMATYRFNFIVTASKGGTFHIGPFEATADGRTKRIGGQDLKFEVLKNDPNMEIGFSLPRNTIYVGERLPLTIQWAYSGDINQVKYAFTNLQIRSPLFEHFSFQNKKPRTRTTLTLTTAKGAVEVDAEVTKETRQGKDFIVVKGKRLLVADTPGDFDFPITCRTKIVTRWGADFIGNRVAIRDAPALGAGKPLAVTVKQVPQAGRPESFTGAVGTGFSIDVTANRSVIRVGDPISLDVTIKGNADLERLSLPPLSADGALSTELFQFPKEQPTGTVVEGTKQFKVNVRVKKESVSQLPGIPFSWFDPAKQEFQTVLSKPIALNVLPAQIVSASNVVTNSRNRSSSTQSKQTPTTDRGLSFVGANLGIEKDLTKLVRSANRTGPPWLLVGLYTLGIVVVVAATVVTRRRQVDPVQQRRRDQFKKHRRDIESARALSGKDAAEQIASALRGLLAEQDDPAVRRQIDALISRCDNLVYAPTDDDTAVIEDLVVEALEIFNKLHRA